MKTYVIKCDISIMELLTNKIDSNGGEIVYSSPILPIVGVKLSEQLKKEIEDTFELNYIIENPTGSLQEIKGTLNEASKMPVFLIPSLDSQGLRYLDKTGWGTAVAVLDSGVNEKWVSEHHDYSGFGSTAGVDHGTKVANIIRQFAPGSRILSFKVCHTKEVNYLNALAAVNDAVGKADIINMSIGFDIDTCSLQNPCAMCESINYYTVNQGKLFVVAAGNTGIENSIQCPGNAQETITVGSIKHDSYELADYSSKGVPGIKKPNIITTGTIYYTEDQGYSSGTSFSTPIITGVMAAIFDGINKNISKAKSYLYTTARDLDLPEHHQGFGLLDLDKFMEVLQNDQNNSKGEGQIQN